MPLLEAFLALALTMLSLAMVATLMVEFVHRAFRMRAKDFKTMLEQLYESEIKPEIEEKLKLTGQALDDEKAKFMKKMSTNQLLVGKRQGIRRFIILSAKPLESLNTLDFFKRLADTEIGKEVKTQVEGEIDEFVDRLSHAYEAFSVSANDMFKRRATMLSFIAGIIVAFVLNTHALNIFQKYLDDPQVRAVAVAQAEQISNKFEKSLAEPDSKGFSDLSDAQKELENFSKEVENLKTLGIQFGYNNSIAPGKLFKDHRWNIGWNQSSKNGNHFPILYFIGDVLYWFLAVLGTGFLIGLGGPFWFDVVNKITDVLKVVRGGAATTDSPDQKRVDVVVTDDPMKVNKDAFKKTGEAPSLVKAQTQLEAANKAAMDADISVKVAGEALNVAKQAARDVDDQRIQQALADVKDSFAKATMVQKKVYEQKAIAVQSYSNVEAQSKKTAGPNE